MAETYTYRVVLRHSGPWVGCESEDEYDLSEFNYSDQEWDDLEDIHKHALLEDWAEQEFWNAGYEYHGEVKSGD